MADSKNNNILFTEGVKNNTITTSDNSDIVFMLYGNDTITYTGGDDYYYSSMGDDKYIVNKFDKNSLHVTDLTHFVRKNESVFLNGKTKNDNGKSARINRCNFAP